MELNNYRLTHVQPTTISSPHSTIRASLFNSIIVDFSLGNTNITDDEPLRRILL